MACRWRLRAGLQSANGFITFTPAGSKSVTFLVTTMSPCTRAVAAIRLSLMGIARPRTRRLASNAAQCKPVSASHGKQWRRRTPSSNHCSRAARLFPRGNQRIPNLTSPSMTGSTAITLSCRRSHSTTESCGFGRVGSLSTLASTRYFTRCPSTRPGWGRSTPYRGMRAANQPDPRWGEARNAGADTHRDVDVRSRIVARHGSYLAPESVPEGLSDPGTIPSSSSA